VPLDARVEEHPRDVREGRALGKLEACVLQVEQGLAEGVALFGVDDGLLDRACGDDGRSDGYEQALLGQLGGQMYEAPTLDATEQVRCRNPGFVEEEFRGVRSMLADLVQDPPSLEFGAIGVSITIREMPRPRAAGSVLATTMTMSACDPLEMKVFDPRMR
jgi:hypothetical protein